MLQYIWSVAHSKWIDGKLAVFIEWAFKRRTDLDVRDYSGLLRLADDCSVAELEVNDDDWMADRELKHLKLTRRCRNPRGSSTRRRILGNSAR